MKRKALAVLLAVMLAAILLLSSCGGGNETSSDPLESIDGSTPSSEPVSGETSDTDPSSSDPSSTDASTTTKKPGASTTKKPTATTAPKKPSSNAKQVTISIADYEADCTDYEALYFAIEDVKLRILGAEAAEKNEVYTLKLRSNKKYKIDRQLELKGCRNLTIDGNGSTIVMTTNQTALRLQDNYNLTLKNLSLDYDPLYFTQGTIQAISGNNLTLKIDAGYRDDFENFLTDTYLTMRLHDSKTGGHLAGSTVDYEVQKLKRTSSGVLTAVLSIPYTDAASYRPQVGNRFSLYKCKSGAVIMKNCTDTTFNGFNVYGSIGFGIHEIAGPGGTVMKNCKIVPGAKPAGATKDRLLSTLGDATHFQSTIKGPTLENCTITHCCDDGINAHGFFYRVMKVSGKEVWLAFPNADDWAAGDTINAYARNTYALRGSATIKSIELVKTDLTPDQGGLGGNTSYANGHAYHVVLDKAISGLSVGDDFSNPKAMSSGATVRNCTFGYNRARGIVLKGENCVVENNKIIGSSAAGIMVISELSWVEGGFPNGSVIRNNTITDCALESRQIQGTSAVAGIMVLLDAKNSDFYPCTEIRNITISGNTVTNHGTYGIFVSNCNGVTVKDNKIYNPFSRGVNKIGNSYGLTAKSGILIGMSKNITVTGNTVQCGKDEITKAVEILSNCSSVKANSGNTFSR